MSNNKKKVNHSPIPSDSWFIKKELKTLVEQIFKIKF